MQALLLGFGVEHLPTGLKAYEGLLGIVDFVSAQAVQCLGPVDSHRLHSHQQLALLNLQLSLLHL